MSAVEAARLVAGEGIEGNVDRVGVRQVTILDADAWEAATAEAGADLDPSHRRANLLVRGVSLADSAGRVLRVGPCRIEIRGETRPCGRMEQTAPGLLEALEPAWRGGAYGVVLQGGELGVGNAVAWTAVEAAAGAEEHE